jgi:hypothetical protein
MLVAACSAVLSAQTPGWHARPEVVQRTATSQPGFNYDEARVGAYTLPDPLRLGDGAVATRSTWPSRRSEILELFRDNVYGRRPGKPESLRFETLETRANVMDGAATLKRVAIISGQGGREHRFEITLFVPDARPGRVPVLLLLNNRPPSNVDPTRREKSPFWPPKR